MAEILLFSLATITLISWEIPVCGNPLSRPQGQTSLHTRRKCQKPAFLAFLVAKVQEHDTSALVSKSEARDTKRKVPERIHSAED